MSRWEQSVGSALNKFSSRTLEVKEVEAVRYHKLVPDGVDWRRGEVPERVRVEAPKNRLEVEDL